MNLKFLAAAILTVLALPVIAGFDTISRAYEVRADFITVPTTENSNISFSECEDCNLTTARLTLETRYTINGRNVRFDEFRQALLSAKQSEESGAVVLHHLESDTVTSVSVILKQ